ncbi:MAG TPA: hypothetical protein VGD61_01515 [Pyrinomonadaceae bacterium]
MIAKQGLAWHGSYALLDIDEVSYSAYLNSLIEGHPRQNNPYLGAGATHESLFSIQFIPPLAIALLARSLGISTSTTFILLLPLMAFASSLAVFWMLYQITNNEAMSAVGTLIVLLCGRLISESPFSIEQTYSSFAFLRRYVPGVPFPVFFLFCTFAWRAFSEKSKTWSLATGGLLAVLIYSYFYLWTAAAAWIFCFSIVWLLARPKDRRETAKRIVIIAGVSLSALIPYLYFISNRSQTVDTEYLTHTRTPDLLRTTEIAGFVIVIILVIKLRQRVVSWQSPAVLFVVACAATPIVAFNQQILTGLSLQSFHYEQFIINYLVLASLVVTYHLLWPHLKIRPIVWTLFALGVGLATAIKEVRDKSAINLRRDEAKPVFERLRNSHVGLTLFNNSLSAASALTDCSMPQLWAPNMHFYGGVDDAERLERFYQYLYLLGVDSQGFEEDLQSDRYVRAAVFGLHRVNATLSSKLSPVSDDEIRAKVDLYSTFVKNFSQDQANKWPLSYVVMLDDGDYDFTNMDHWYNRSPGEKIGNSVLYTVQLKGNLRAPPG